MLTRAQKQEQVVEMRDKLSRAESIFLADPIGLKVGEDHELRAQLRARGEGAYEYRVVKNAVLRLACQDGPTEPLVRFLEGPTAVAISYGDPVGLAKVLSDYAKAHDVFELKGGFLDGRPIDTTEIAKLATLPNLEALRGQIVGLLQAPAAKLARLLNEPAAQLARLVEARRGMLAEGGEG